MSERVPELLPCPFCGGPVEVVRDHTAEGTDWIRHTDQPCAVSFDNFGHEEPVEDMWNFRAHADAEKAEAVREAYERAARECEAYPFIARAIRALAAEVKP